MLLFSFEFFIFTHFISSKFLEDRNSKIKGVLVVDTETVPFVNAVEASTSLWNNFKNLKLTVFSIDQLLSNDIQGYPSYQNCDEIDSKEKFDKCIKLVYLSKLSSEEHQKSQGVSPLFTTEKDSSFSSSLNETFLLNKAVSKAISYGRFKGFSDPSIANFLFVWSHRDFEFKESTPEYYGFDAIGWDAFMNFARIIKFTVTSGVTAESFSGSTSVVKNNVNMLELINQFLIIASSDFTATPASRYTCRDSKFDYINYMYTTPENSKQLSEPRLPFSNDLKVSCTNKMAFRPDMKFVHLLNAKSRFNRYGTAYCEVLSANNALLPHDHLSIPYIRPSQYLRSDPELSRIIPVCHENDMLVNDSDTIPLMSPEINTDITESKNNETNSTESENNETNSTESKNNETNSTESKNNETNSTESENNETNSTESENNETNSTESENNETNSTESENNETNSTESENNETNSTESENNETNSTESENNETNSTESENNETNSTELGNNETNSTELENNETKLTESENNETKLTESENNKTNSTESKNDETNSTESENSEDGFIVIVKNTHVNLLMFSLWKLLSFIAIIFALLLIFAILCRITKKRYNNYQNRRTEVMYNNSANRDTRNNEKEIAFNNNEFA